MTAAYTPGADLHLHSFYSDGTFSPQEIVALAARHRLNPIALTDHDTVAGIPEALHAGAAMNIEVIPAVELSVYEDHDEMHILGFFLRWQEPRFRAILNGFERRRRERLEEILTRLHRLGIPLALSEVLQVAGPGTIGRLHVARALVARGVADNIDEAFDHYLAQGRPAYAERAGFTPPQAIEAIQHAGGLAVLAHPGQRGLALLPRLVEAGLHGIEVFHPSHTPEDIVTLTRLATEQDLLITGGSDCHGLAKGKARLGEVRLPHAYVERLRCAALTQPPTPSTQSPTPNTQYPTPHPQSS